MTKTRPIAKYIQEVFSTIWKKYGSEELSKSKIVKLFPKYNKQVLRNYLSKAVKSGWIKIEVDQKDKKRRIYTLREPNEIMKELER
jgi:hypothetical protein